MGIFCKYLFYVLVPVQYVPVFWTLAAHLVFSFLHLVFLSYVCSLQNPFEIPKPASKITEIDEKEANQERTFIDVQASDDDIYLD